MNKIILFFTTAVKRMLLTLLPSEHEKPTHGYHNNSATIHFFTQRDVNIHPSNEYKKYHKPRPTTWL